MHLIDMDTIIPFAIIALYATQITMTMADGYKSGKWFMLSEFYLYSTW